MAARAIWGAGTCCIDDAWYEQPFSFQSQVMASETPGRRIPGILQENIILRPGEYGKLGDGTWHAHPPWKYGCANLARHKVVEHEDGTITVSPSILVTSGNEQGPVSWHGYLERGVWREV